jgi:hypothetical protein
VTSPRCFGKGLGKAYALLYHRAMLEEKPQEETKSPTPPAEAEEKKRPEPTRYGDWEIGGHCIDF